MSRRRAKRAYPEYVPRVARASLPDGHYHVFARGIASPAELFRDADDRDVFVKLLAHVARRHAWRCHAACVLSTHYHIVLETARPALSSGLQKLNWRYARYVNQRHGGFGHVFADRYSVRVIASEEYLFEACAYVLLNPVRAGLCVNVEDWPWSYGPRGLLAA